MTVVFLSALLLLNVALRSLPVRRRGGDEDGDALSAVECGFLRAGVRAAVLVQLALLHARAGDESDDPFEQAVLDAGDPPTGTWGVARNRGVRRAAAEVRERLVDDGLLAPTGHWAIARFALVGVPVLAVLAVVDQPLDLVTVLGAAIAVVLAAALWWAPRRTVAGWRALRAQRRRYERVTLADPDAPADPGAVGMLVALQGQPALDLVTRVPDLPPPTHTTEPAPSETGIRAGDQ